MVKCGNYGESVKIYSAGGETGRVTVFSYDKEHRVDELKRRI